MQNEGIKGNWQEIEQERDNSKFGGLKYKFSKRWLKPIVCSHMMLEIQLEESEAKLDEINANGRKRKKSSRTSYAQKLSASY